MGLISWRSKVAASDKISVAAKSIENSVAAKSIEMITDSAAALQFKVLDALDSCVNNLELDQLPGKEVNATVFKKMLHNAAHAGDVAEDDEHEKEKAVHGGRKRSARDRVRKFSAAAKIVKRLIQLSNLVRKKQANTHFGIVVADFLTRQVSLPKSSDTVNTSCWDNAADDTFHVRGKNFLSDSRKVKAGEPHMKLIAAHWLKSDKREDNLAGRPTSIVQILTNRLQEIKGQTPFFVVINLQVPGTTTHSLSLYYMTNKRLEDEPLLLKFVNGDDEFRNSRFKLIPRVVQGSWLVKQAVGKTACLIGRALTINYHTASNYIELDIDIGSSSVAKTVVGLAFGCLRNLVVEMAFLIQANTEEELPERLLGSSRLSYLDIKKAMPLTVE